jgi:tRNA(adenine34) deaminase
LELENTADYQFMKEALKEAVKAYKKDETPVGAVIVKDGRIISRAHNEKELKSDPTLHAEITAIKKACKKLKTWRLNECDMYVTLEPCAMCAGAIIQARVGRLFIGTPDPKAGAVGSVIDILSVEKFNHKVEVSCGILKEECSKILKDFFRELRQRNDN